MQSSLLFFQSPLQGNFEVLTEQSLHEDHEVAVSYSLTAATPKHDLLTNTNVKALPELPDLGWKTDYRIEVDHNEITTQIAGTEIHYTTITGEPASWLMIRARSPRKQDLRIVREPTIPDELNLLNMNNRRFWRADYYHGLYSPGGSAETSMWHCSGEEVEGDELSGRIVENLESLTFSQRPMLEDGEFTFEMYFVPGEYEVHPSLGSAAYLLRPNGVKRHKLTDGEYERSGRAADNETEIEGAAESVELHTNDWNRVQLALTGPTHDHCQRPTGGDGHRDRKTC